MLNEIQTYKLMTVVLFAIGFTVIKFSLYSSVSNFTSLVIKFIYFLLIDKCHLIYGNTAQNKSHCNDYRSISSLILCVLICAFRLQNTVNVLPHVSHL